MKKFIKLLDLNKNGVTSLQMELLRKLQDYFNFRMQLKLGHLKQFHMLKIVRRNIASIKHFLSRNRNMYMQNIKNKENK